MQISIQPTKLSSETLNRIDRVAAILGSGDESYTQTITTTIVGLVEMGYLDGLERSCQILTNQEPETFPNDLNWDQVGNGQLNGEVH